MKPRHLVTECETTAVALLCSDHALGLCVAVQCCVSISADICLRRDMDLEVLRECKTNSTRGTHFLKEHSFDIFMFFSSLAGERDLSDTFKPR